MARVPILHGALVLLRGEAEHRSSTMEAVVLFSEEERRICRGFVLRLFQAAEGAVIQLRAGGGRASTPQRRTNGQLNIHARTCRDTHARWRK